MPACMNRRSLTIAVALILVAAGGALIDHFGFAPSPSVPRAAPSPSASPGGTIMILFGNPIRLGLEPGNTSIFETPAFQTVIGGILGAIGLVIGALVGVRFGARSTGREARSQRTFENRVRLAEQDRINFDRRVSATEKDANHLAHTVAALRTLEVYLTQPDRVASATSISFDGEGLRNITLAARVEELAVRVASLRGSRGATRNAIVTDSKDRLSAVLPEVVDEYTARTAAVEALKTDGAKALQDQIDIKLDPTVPG
jgi:hypothetical protein